MKRLLTIIFMFVLAQSFGQVRVTKEGYPNFPKKPQETTISTNDTVLISKVDGIVRGISYDDFTAGLSGGGAITVDNALNGSSTNPVENQVIVTELGNYGRLDQSLWTLTDSGPNFDIKRGTDNVGTWDSQNQINFGNSLSSISYRGTFANLFVDRIEFNLWLDSAGDLLPVGVRPIAYTFDGVYDSPTDVPKKADIDAALAGLGGGADNSISEADQSVDGVTRDINTINAGIFTISQDGVILLRGGNNNDNALYVLSLEAMPGSGNTTVPFISPPQLPVIDTSTILASTHPVNALVQDSSDGNIYFSNGSSWIDLTGGTNNDAFTNQQALTGAYTALGSDFTSGRKIIYNNTATDHDVTLNDVAITGQKLYFSQFSTGKVRVVVQGLGYQTVDNTSTFLLYKTDLGTYRPEGDYETFTPADTTPPSVPTGLVSTGQTSTTITLDWVASTDNFGVTSYEVSLDDGSPVDTGSSLTGFTFVGLTASTAYDFKVRGKDAAGNVSAYTANINVSTTAPSSDPFAAASPVAYYSPASIDPSVTVEGNSVTVWNDEINAYNGTSAGGTAPILNISPGGQRQVRGNGTDSWFNVGQVAAMNFQGGVDEFTIAVQLGENPGTQGSWFTKAGASSGSRQYTLYNPSTGDDVQYLVGGSGVAVENNLSGGDLIILQVSTTDATVSVNGVDVITGGAIGTATESQDINIGARTNGSFVFNGDMTRIAIFNRLLTAQEETDFATYAANNQ